MISNQLLLNESSDREKGQLRLAKRRLRRWNRIASEGNWKAFRTYLESEGISLDNALAPLPLYKIQNAPVD